MRSVVAAALLCCCDALRVGGAPKLLQKASSTPIEPTLDNARAAALWAGGAALLAVVEPAAASDVGWVAPTKFLLQPLLTIGTLAFLMRTVLSWFPKYDLNQLPWVMYEKQWLQVCQQDEYVTEAARTNPVWQSGCPDGACPQGDAANCPTGVGRRHLADHLGLDP